MTAHDDDRIVTPLAACTIVAHNYLALARILAASFLEWHPEATFHIVVVDRPAEARLIRDQQFEVVPITDIDFGPEGFAHMATMYDVTEFATSVKPFALQHLLRQHECVLYIDPDIKLYARLDPLLAATQLAGWSLTPHCLEPIPRDGTSPTEFEIMQSGIYNLGYIGVTRAARPMLEWWSERLRRDAIIEPSVQLFTDQRWIDLAVPIFGPHIERSPAYNVAYWNIDQRALWRDGDTLMVGDEVLRFFHFSGYDPKNPHWLSKYHPGRPRVLMSENRVLADLCTEYGDELERSRAHAGSATASYGWAEAFPGMPLTRAIRRMFRAEVLESELTDEPPPPSPFTPDGAQRFRNWLRSVPSDSQRRLPRYLSAIYDERGDLRQHFPGVESGDTDGFALWASTTGPAECPSIRLFGAGVGDDSQSWATADDLGRDSDGVDLIGYLNAELGVGEAGRLIATALSAVDVPVSSIGCRRTVSRQTHPFEVAGAGRHDLVIMAINADQLGLVRHEFGQAFFTGRYIIGQWFWELDEFPRTYDWAYGLVHEVWAATEHIRRALERNAPSNTKVHLMQLPLVAPEVIAGAGKDAFGLQDRFTFLFSFDLMSVLERKNPLGLVRAFKLAFRPDEGPVLVIKTINGQRQIDALERLRWECRDRRDIIVMDGYLDHGMTGSLTAACDCYVSLHRAEGLGLTMSEAMALGKPVIATAYSGNLDFMTDDTAMLIPWQPVKVGAKAAPYPATASWAEPDLEAAVGAMRRVANDPVFAAGLGAAAQADLARRFSPAVTGARMKAHLDEIRRRNTNG